MWLTTFNKANNRTEAETLVKIKVSVKTRNILFILESGQNSSTTSHHRNFTFGQLGSEKKLYSLT